jgi:hypothetical protein
MQGTFVGFFFIEFVPKCPAVNVSGNLPGDLLVGHVQLDVQPDDLLLHEQQVRVALAIIFVTNRTETMPTHAF